ncbi:hypothetical protein [Erwinia persicina]|uniref:hypothetical protein n=1 Tax=Erwinia persicina TaxID=55211 RepID=UPI001782DFB3|nr:hypothetical protein [Erwinia persicina]MBD8214479.1 hypothetical protein [Erwinia persicina]
MVGLLRANTGSFFRAAGFFTFGRLSADMNKTTGDSVIENRVEAIAHLGLCGVLLACSRGALALECHINSDNGITEEIENMGVFLW